MIYQKDEAEVYRMSVWQVVGILKLHYVPRRVGENVAVHQIFPEMFYEAFYHQTYDMNVSSRRELTQRVEP